MGNPEKNDHANLLQFTCSICKRRVTLRRDDSQNLPKFFPFCSERCKLIDLGAWLDSQYRISSLPDEMPAAPATNENRFK